MGGRRTPLGSRPRRWPQLDGALGLWRGPALADIADELFAQVEASRLEELRLTALEERFDAQLALGEHHRLVAELDSLVRRHPLRERLRGAADARLVPVGSPGRGATRVRQTPGARSSTSLVSSPGLSCNGSSRRSCATTPRSPRRAELGLVVAAGWPPSRRCRCRWRLPLLAGVVLLAGGKGARPARQCAIAPTCGRVRLDANRQADRPHRGAECAAPVERSSAARSGICPSTGILSKIDPQTGNVVGTANTPPVPCGLAAGEGALWVSDCSSPTVVRIDPAHDVVVGRTTLPVPRQRARRRNAERRRRRRFHLGRTGLRQSKLRLAARSGKRPRAASLRHPRRRSGGSGVRDGALWVGGGVIGRLSRIDPATNEVTSPARDLGEWLCCVAAGGGYVWAAINPGGTVWKLASTATS